MLFGEIRRNAGNARCFAIPLGLFLLAQACEQPAAMAPKPYGFPLLLQLRAFPIEQLLPFRHQFIQHTGFALTRLAKLAIETFPGTIQQFEHGHDFQLQGLRQPTQLRELRLVAEIQGRPALTRDEAMPFAV